MEHEIDLVLLHNTPDFLPACLLKSMLRSKQKAPHFCFPTSLLQELTLDSPRSSLTRLNVPTGEIRVPPRWAHMRT